MFSIFFVEFFAKVAFGDSLNVYANFRHFTISFYTLFRGATGENWNGIMYDAAMQQDGCVLTDDLQYNISYCGFCAGFPYDHNRPQCDNCIPLNGCFSSQGLTFFLFVLYQLVITFVTFNVFIAVILEAYDESEDRDSAEIKDEQLDAFVKTWSIFDPDGDHRIPLIDVVPLLNRVQHPLGYLSPRLKIINVNMDGTYNVCDVKYGDKLYENVPRSLLILPDHLSVHPDEIDELPLEAGTEVFKQIAPKEAQAKLVQFNLTARQEEGSEPSIFFLELCIACARRAYASQGILEHAALEVDHQLIEKAVSQAIPGAKSLHKKIDGDAHAYISLLNIANTFKKLRFRKQLHEKVVKFLKTKQANPTEGTKQANPTEGTI